MHRIATTACLPWQSFGAGREVDKANANAKANIWADAAKFKFNSNSGKLTADATALSVAAKHGKLDQLKAAFDAYAGNCTTCRDEFQNK